MWCEDMIGDLYCAVKRGMRMVRGLQDWLMLVRLLLIATAGNRLLSQAAIRIEKLKIDATHLIQ